MDPWLASTICYLLWSSERHVIVDASKAAISRDRAQQQAPPRSLVHAAAPRDTCTSPWASLHEDLVSLMSYRVLAGDLLDYVRFRATCLRWRQSTPCPRGRGVADPRFHPRRWMLLPEGHGHARFFNLATSAFVSARVPHLRDHCVLDSVDGVLLLHRRKLYMLNRPAFYDEPEVLQINPYQQEGMHSSNPSSATLPPPKMIAKCPASTNSVAYVYYMVECNSEVLVVTLNLDGYRQCLVYRLADLALGKTVPVTLS
ncbi:hypothetical protein PR202_gb03102 [Eleusine coracana subsp. coracana]|uniref:DUF295 domain-containing protein n=1 Tax=Eleusine coracana subsp. coracana TaxID=191504 RepID=A0AAV5E162_ELECO|nr:hypothetical protein PR202_gb03102 [Eleusine coracana subsp. coracana]